MEEEMSQSASHGLVTPGADRCVQEEAASAAALAVTAAAWAAAVVPAAHGPADVAGNEVRAQLLEVMPKVLRAPGGAPISRLVEDGELLERYLEMTRALPPQAQQALFIFVQGAYRQSYQHMHTQAATFFKACSAIQGFLDSDDHRLLRQLRLDLVKVRRLSESMDSDTANLRRCIDRHDFNSIAGFCEGLMRGIDNFNRAYGDLGSLMKRVRERLSSIKQLLEQGEKRALQCKRIAEHQYERCDRIFSRLDGLNSFIRSVTVASSISLVAMNAVASALAGCHIAFALQLGGAAAFSALLTPFAPVVCAVALGAAVAAATAASPATACAVAQAAAGSPAGAAALAVSPLYWVAGSSVLMVLIFIGSANRKILKDVLARIWERDIERCGGVEKFYRDMKVEVDGMERTLQGSLPEFKNLDEAFDTIRGKLEVLKLDAEELEKRAQIPAGEVGLEDQAERLGELLDSVADLEEGMQDLSRQLGGAARGLHSVLGTSFLRAGEVTDEA